MSKYGPSIICLVGALMTHGDDRSVLILLAVFFSVYV